MRARPGQKVTPQEEGARRRRRRPGRQAKAG